MTLNVLLLFSSSILGIFLGAQIMEAILFVPNWKNLEADDFFRFYQKYGKKIYIFFAPLTVTAIIIPLITVGYSFLYQVENQMEFGLMGGFTSAFFLTFFLYFKKANKPFWIIPLGLQSIRRLRCAHINLMKIQNYG